MTVDQEVTPEPISSKPRSIKESYSYLKENIGQGRNPAFEGAPSEAVFTNYWGPSKERPFLYVEDTEGNIKKWLTQAEIDHIKSAQQTEGKISDTEELLFDMFSLMMGGSKPTLEQIGANSLSELIPRDVPRSDGLAKVEKIFSFVDKHPNTSLNNWLFREVGLSSYEVEGMEETVNGRVDFIILGGETCYTRGTKFVWHMSRNVPDPVRSPFKEDGAFLFNKRNDIQLAYNVQGGLKAVRLNALVFFLARHGISEGVTPDTMSDQVYISLTEYYDKIFPKTTEERQVYHEEENDNFVINYKLEGYKERQRKKRQQIIDKMTELAGKNVLDEILVNIDNFITSKQNQKTPPKRGSSLAAKALSRLGLRK